jgi:hypothetical protein
MVELGIDLQISALSPGLPGAGVFSLYLLKGHILMAERFENRIHVLQIKVCVLLLDMTTNTSIYKNT